MTPVGKCAARLLIAGSTFVANLVILSEYCKELVLGTDFLREYGAVINIRDRSVTFATNSDNVTHEEHRLPRLRIAADDVILLPRSCSLVPVHCDSLQNVTGIAEHINALALKCGVAIARALINVIDGSAELLLANFSKERRHIVIGTAFAYFDEVTQIEDCHLAQEVASTIPAAAPIVDVSPTLTAVERDRLLELINQ